MNAQLAVETNFTWLRCGQLAPVMTTRRVNGALVSAIGFDSRQLHQF